MRAIAHTSRGSLASMCDDDLFQASEQFTRILPSRKKLGTASSAEANPVRELYRESSPRFPEGSAAKDASLVRMVLRFGAATPLERHSRWLE